MKDDNGVDVDDDDNDDDCDKDIDDDHGIFQSRNQSKKVEPFEYQQVMMIK